MKVKYIFKSAGLAAVTALGLLVAGSYGAEDFSTAAGLPVLEKQEKALSEKIVAEPKLVALYSRRGDARLFLGRYREARADYEKMIELDPAQDVPHWRLGIAYYFCGDYEKSARQFEKYHAYGARDRENGIWQFLARVKSAGLEKARAGMLEYTAFDREPFPSLYEMFAGKKSGDEMLAEVKSKGLEKDGAVSFFANYYAGVNEEILGHPEKAMALLGKAAGSEWGKTSEGGPAYMWQCARLHLVELQKKAAKPAGKAPEEKK